MDRLAPLHSNPDSILRQTLAGKHSTTGLQPAHPPMIIREHSSDSAGLPCEPRQCKKLVCIGLMIGFVLFQKRRVQLAEAEVYPLPYFQTVLTLNRIAAAAAVAAAL